MGHHPMGEDVDFNPRFVAERLVDTSAVTMGATAENLHDRFPQLTQGATPTRSPSRSQQRAAAAWAERRHARDRRPDVGLHRRGLEGRRPRRVPAPGHDAWRGSPTLPTPFRPGGRVTAGNSAGLTDGATAALLASEDDGRASSGLEPQHAARRLRVRGRRARADGPRPGARRRRRCSSRPASTLDDIGLFELNEPFAVQVLTLVRRARRRPRGRAAEPVRRRDRLRPPARRDRRAPDRAARVRLPRAARRPLRADRALHRHGHGRGGALGERRMPDTEFQLHARRRPRPGRSRSSRSTTARTTRSRRRFGRAALESLRAAAAPSSRTATGRRSC